MVGILKNPLPKEQLPAEESEDMASFRKQVYENTQLNAKLTSEKKNSSGNQKERKIPKDILSLKHERDAEELLQWNQKNLDENEITKKQYQDIHVDEPKTPYQGAVDPNGEYYALDDETDDLNAFSLGEAEYKIKEPEPSAEAEDEASESELDEEAKHKKFEDMRKKHYNVGEVFKNRHKYETEEADDELQL